MRWLQRARMTCDLYDTRITRLSMWFMCIISRCKSPSRIYRTARLQRFTVSCLTMYGLAERWRSQIIHNPQLMHLLWLISRCPSLTRHTFHRPPSSYRQTSTRTAGILAVSPSIRNCWIMKKSWQTKVTTMPRRNGKWPRLSHTSPAMKLSLAQAVTRWYTYPYVKRVYLSICETN